MGERLAAVRRFRVLTDEQWERIEPLLPSNAGKVGRPFGDHRTVVGGIIYRYRTGIPWRDLPREQFGPWQTVGSGTRGSPTTAPGTASSPS